MSRFTAAYSDMLGRLAEVKALTASAKTFSKKSYKASNIEKTNACCRAGVVLLCSHIEGYIEDLAEIAIARVCTGSVSKSKLPDTFRFYFSKDLIDELKDTADPGSMAVKLVTLFGRDLDIWNLNPSFPPSLSHERFVKGFSNPTTEKIKKFFNRFGFNTYQSSMTARLGANYLICKNMVDQVVNQRNRIAHGDSTLKPTPTDVNQMIDLVYQYCKASDIEVASWFKAKGISIR